MNQVTLCCISTIQRYLAITTLFLALTTTLSTHHSATATDLPAHHALAAKAASTTFLPIIIDSTPPPPTGPVNFGAVHQGRITYYVEADGGGNCLFDPTPNDLMVGAMNHADYDTAALCGAYARIQGPKGTITVRIVDRCPECPPDHIDLSPQAFALIADIPLGIVPVSWQLVSPELSDPIAYRFKAESNPYWSAVQILNHRVPISKVEYLGNDGQFHDMPRQEWNYFVAFGGIGSGSFTFRVTDLFGRTLLDHGIVHQTGEIQLGRAQFPPPP